MRFGLALPQYDFSLPGPAGIDWSFVRDWAHHAEALGFDSVWISDHLFLDVARYGGPDQPRGAMECLGTLAALGAATSRLRLGTLVVCNDLRPPAIVAKTAANIDVISGGRLELGIGAGWYERDFKAAGVPFEPPGVRVSRLAGGFNTVWAWTPETYAGRIAILERAAAAAGRDPRTIRRSVGLYALPGADRVDVAARWDRYLAAFPGSPPPLDLDVWRRDKLCGTPDEIAATVAGFAGLGVEEIILSFGLLPFQVADASAVEYFAEEVFPVTR